MEEGDWKQTPCKTCHHPRLSEDNPEKHAAYSLIRKAMPVAFDGWGAVKGEVFKSVMDIYGIEARAMPDMFEAMVAYFNAYAWARDESSK